MLNNLGYAAVITCGCVRSRMKFSVTIFWLLLLLTVTFVCVSSKRKYRLLN